MLNHCLISAAYLYSCFMPNSHLGANCTVIVIWILKDLCGTGLETGCLRGMRRRPDTGHENCTSLKPMILTGIFHIYLLRCKLISQSSRTVRSKVWFTLLGGVTVVLRSFIRKNFSLMGKLWLLFYQFLMDI